MSKRRRQIVPRTPDEKDRRIAELEAKVRELEEEKQVLEIDGRALTGGAIGQYREEIRSLIHANGEIRRLLEKLADVSEETAEGWALQYEQADSVLFAEPDSRSYMPVLSRIVAYAINGVAEEARGIYDRRGEIIRANASPEDPLLSIKFALERIASAQRLASMYHLGLHFKAWAWGKSKDATLLATDILEQWGRGEDVEPLTVYALCNNWPDAPAKPEKLLEALRLVRQSRKLATTKTQAGIALELSVPERTLRRYHEHVEALEELASHNPARQLD